MLKDVLYVGMGGFMGAVLRYTVTQMMNILTRNHWFPYGTLTVNVLGSALLGFLAGYLSLREGGQSVHLFLIVGFLGGFTTFSTFSHETIVLLRSGQFTGVLGHVLGHLILCIGGAAIGFSFARG